jgi:hypothetical protein
MSGTLQDDEKPAAHDLRQSADPSWYRIQYALATRQLMTALDRRPDGHIRAETSVGSRPHGVRSEAGSPPGTFSSDDIPTLEREVWNLLFPGAEVPAQSAQHSTADLLTAERDAVDLIAATTDVLDADGYRWAGRRPGIGRRWRRLTRKKARWRNRQLDEFLDEVIEPAAVVVFWSVQAASGRAVNVPTKRAWTAPDRRAAAKAAAAYRPQGAERMGDDEALRAWFEAYLLDLEANPALLRRQRLAAFLGARRWRRRAPLNYRVQYNLACLHSRLAGQDRGSELESAANYLRLAVKNAGTVRARRLRPWAWSDPGLSHLRIGMEVVPVRVEV